MARSIEWYTLSEETQNLIDRFLSEYPVRLGALAKELGIIVKKATLAANISGEIRNVDGQVIIKVNRHDVKQRQRFTLAHEIGHFLLHYDQIGDGIIDDVLYRSGLSDSQEAEANRLAADIVMPWELVKERLDAYSDLQKEEQNEILANEFDVSITAIKIRLKRK